MQRWVLATFAMELTKGWRTQREEDSRRRRLLLSGLRNAKNTLVLIGLSRFCRGAAFELSGCHSYNLRGEWEGFRHDNGLINKTKRECKCYCDMCVEAD